VQQAGVLLYGGRFPGPGCATKAGCQSSVFRCGSRTRGSGEDVAVFVVAVVAGDESAVSEAPALVEVEGGFVGRVDAEEDVDDLEQGLDEVRAEPAGMARCTAIRV